MTTDLLASARARVSELRERFESYSGGDRPQSPPASLLRDLFAAEREVEALMKSLLEPQRGLPRGRR